MVASPYARKLAADAGVDLAQARGTGPDGRIVAADVEQLIRSGTSAAAPSAPDATSPTGPEAPATEVMDMPA